MKTKHLNQVEVFWDNGHYVAVVEDENGTRRNVARYNCQTKRLALDDARDWLGMERLYLDETYTT